MKGHRNNRYKFKFNSLDKLNKFILCYGDLFTPYSEVTIRQAAYVADGEYVNTNVYGNHKTYGHLDERMVAMMSKGYVIRGKIIYINCTKEAIDEILESGIFETEIEDTIREHGKSKKVYVCKE